MAIQPRLTTAEKVRRAANMALAAAEDMEVGSKTMGRVERLIDEVERAAKDMRAAVRGSGVR